VRAVRTASVVTGPEPGGGDCVPSIVPSLGASRPSRVAGALPGRRPHGRPQPVYI